MTVATDPELKVLLEKYAGSRTPLLVDLEDPELGLINDQLLQIYHSGIMSRYSVPVGILLPAPRYSSLEEKWQQGDFRLNEWAEPWWSPFCRALRKTQGNEPCELCDRHRAMIAEQAGDAIAYLCDNGLVDFAAPIKVRNEVVAVVFCGQFKPAEGSIWNPELIKPDGCYRPLEAGEDGVDALAESRRRIRANEQRARLPEGALSNFLSGSDSAPVEIFPEKVEEFRKFLRMAAGQLGDLATSTYELEKGKVVAWIRSAISRSLKPLSTTATEASEVWNRLSIALEPVTEFFGLSYALILSCDNESRCEIRVLSQSAPPQINFPVEEPLSASEVSFSRLRSTILELKRPTSFVLREYADLPVFDQLRSLHARSKGSKSVVVIPIPMPARATGSILLLGNVKKDLDFDDFLPDDQDALMSMVADVSLVLQTVVLVGQLEEITRKQALFLEDVAHDVRTPIQNILVEAEMLNRSLDASEEVKRLATQLASQARRLHLMSERVWTLVGLDRGLIELDETQPVRVHETIYEHRKQLLDLATRQDIQILVDQELQRWPAIQVNRTLFSQAILNLLDNAIKYSKRGKEIRVDGKRLPSGITLSFVNRGIPIREEDKDRIFERYYRTEEAQTHMRAGTGIGLFIVKTFVDSCGGRIEVKSVPISGTQDYVTEFKLFIPDRRW